jgi:uncharacterized protein (TIRG00374 family)
MNMLVSAIQNANLIFYSTAFFAILANILFHSLMWRSLLLSLSLKSSIRKIFSFIWVSNFVDILVPAESISGEITRAYLMSRSLGGKTGAVTASIIGHRVIYTTTSLIGLVAGSSYLTIKYGISQPIQSLVAVMTIAASGTLVFLIVILLNREVALKIINYISDFIDRISKKRWNLAQIKPRIIGIVDSFYEGIKTFRDRPSQLLLPIIFSLAAWLSKLAITMIVFASLGIVTPFSAIIVVFSLADALNTIPLGIPGEIGVMEIIMTGFFTALGIHPVLSASATMLIRIVTMWFVLFSGGIMIQLVGLKNIEQ